MAVDIKKVLTSLKERKETMLVWGLGAIAFSLGLFLLIGYIREASPPPSLEVIVKRPEPPKSNGEITEKALTELREAQRIPPFVNYRDILTKNLFTQSRMTQIEGGKIVVAGGFVLKGLIQMPDKIKAFINDPAGKPHLVAAGQMIGTSEVKVMAIDFKNQSATLRGKGWEKPQVITMAREKVMEAGGLITYKPGGEEKEVEKPKKVTEEEAKKAVAEAKKALSEASDVILTARSEGVDTDEAEARRDDAKVKLQDAQEAMREKDYQRAKESAKSAQALAREAKRLVGEEEEEEGEEERRKEKRKDEEGEGEEEMKEEPEGTEEEPGEVEEEPEGVEEEPEGVEEEPGGTEEGPSF